jgi:hypothetical protein
MPHAERKKEGNEQEGKRPLVLGNDFLLMQSQTLSLGKKICGQCTSEMGHG